VLLDLVTGKNGQYMSFVDWCIVTDISGDHNAFMFWVKQFYWSVLDFLDTEDKGTASLAIRL